MKRTFRWVSVALFIISALIFTACTSAETTVTQTTPVSQTVPVTTTPPPTTNVPPTTTALPATTVSTPTSTVPATTQAKTIIEDAIDVGFDQNPVPVQDGYFRWKVILTETKGIGVTLKTLTVQHYSATGPASLPKTYDTLEWFQGWLPNAYLAPYGKASFGAGFPAQPMAYDTYIITGIDDKGQEIRTVAKVEFVPVINDAVTISFEPDPVVFNASHVNWKVTLTENKSVGVTLKSLTVQYYSNSGLAGSPMIYNTKEWFENWLPKAYLAANGNASFGAGTDTSDTLSYCVYAFTGVDDNGVDIVATGKINFTR